MSTVEMGMERRTSHGAGRSHAGNAVWGECSEQLTAFGRLLALDGDVPGPERLSSRRLQHTPCIRSGSPIWVERYGADGYHKCVYQPMGWKQPSRFVVMRIRKDRLGDPHLKLLDSENSVYRVCVTNEPARPHRVIDDDDQRAYAEHLIGDTQREGVLAITSRSVRAHHGFFQVVMGSYTLWRWTKRLAGVRRTTEARGAQRFPNRCGSACPVHTILIARLTRLFVARRVACTAIATRFALPSMSSEPPGRSTFSAIWTAAERSRHSCGWQSGQSWKSA